MGWWRVPSGCGALLSPQSVSPPSAQTTFHSASLTGCTESRVLFTSTMSLSRGSCLHISSVTGRGIGRRTIERALDQADGPVKLHVEYDNPAKRLYERIGFTSKYAEMRYEA